AFHVPTLSHGRSARRSRPWAHVPAGNPGQSHHRPLGRFSGDTLGPSLIDIEGTGAGPLAIPQSWNDQNRQATVAPIAATRPIERSRTLRRSSFRMKWQAMIAAAKMNFQSVIAHTAPDWPNAKRATRHPAIVASRTMTVQKSMSVALISMKLAAFSGMIINRATKNAYRAASGMNVAEFAIASRRLSPMAPWG